MSSPTSPGAEHLDTQRRAIVVDRLWECFRVYSERPPGLKERILKGRRAVFTEFAALKDVSLEIRHGESVALVGHNGSGKSTLLKCLARILPPDRGSVAVHGRIATLLELGAGFHPDLSGRENVYLNGSILGLSRREIDEQFDSIVEFAGVREFIDTPVRNYSSGMYVRLGFAIAVHVDPDILLVDEVLSVGDAAFQEKSLARMRSFNQRGKTVVLVSHDLAAVRSLCERVVVLDHGRVIFDGGTEEGVERYLEVVHGAAPPPEPEPAPEEPGRNGDFRARIVHASLTAAGREVGDAPVAGGAQASLTVEVEAREDLVPDGGLTVGMNVRRPDMSLYVYETRTSWRTLYVAPPPVGHNFAVRFDLDLHLLSGRYLVDLLVANATTNAIHDRWQAALEFDVRSPEYEFGVAALDARVHIDNPDGIWPPESHPPPLEEGGPRYHPVRDGAVAPQ